jgi:erythromycin esterase-like protein
MRNLVNNPDQAQALDAIRAAAVPLTGGSDDHAALLALIGDAHVVLLGEASHGTHEFYRERARITQRLIAAKGFDAVAVEGDWPDAYRINRFVRGRGDDAFAVDALAGFRRFPTWMWRNTDVVEFIDWQRAFNAGRPVAQRTGFYGLDLYSLHSSMDAVLHYFDRTDPQAARRARERYACFDQFGPDSQVYGMMTGLGHAPSCEAEVIAMLVELRRHAAHAARDDGADRDDAFDAEQNARLVKNAEGYYRSMYLSEVSSWNLRDRHMDETLAALERHLGGDGTGRARPRIVVWAHNSHLGDARATEMGQHRGELNVGQLVRERHGRDAVLVGFSTHHGSVTAASDWGAPCERKQVLPSRDDSIEGLMHASGLARFMLPLRDDARLAQALRQPRLERAIGVIYRPDTERWSHYFHAQLPAQFDALIHLDTTRAVEPLERNAEWRSDEVSESYPTGL